jgi:hypothetical protein
MYTAVEKARIRFVQHQRSDDEFQFKICYEAIF